MTEMEVRQPDQNLTAQMTYARTVATASMLPEAYRNKPADILLAVGLGQAMGLSPAESLYRIAVIKGKPTASAELIGANVRKAGHKLRVHGDETTCTATIIRADDPDYEFTVTRDLDWAKRMKLETNDNYRKQPGTMLQWRAITAVARLACSEALYGVQHTPDELYDSGPQVSAPAAGGLAAALADPEPAEAEPESGGFITPAQQRKLGATMREAGITDRDSALAYVADVIGREVGSRNELTRDEASDVIDALARDLRPVDGEVVEEPEGGES